MKDNQIPKENFSKDFKSIYPYALRGELKTVFNILDTINIKKLSDKQKEKRILYYNRFINQTEKYDFNTKDASIIQFVKLFHNYWQSVVLEKSTLKKADSLLEENVSNYIFETHFKVKKIPLKNIKDSLYTYSNKYLKDLGYFSNCFGKTGDLYDLFLWKNNELKSYPIRLINDSVNVKVNFLTNFIATGWAHYTTFGRSYAGGWATREALFSVGDAYDRNSENFKVSYLKHEGQHFADYKNFPNLKQADLEYRAKLVELASSKTTTYQLINNFIANGKNQKNNAHAFANYGVIRDLSMLIFHKNYIDNLNDWKKVDIKIIKEKSRFLFLKNTKALKKIGAKKVTNFIN